MTFVGNTCRHTRYFNVKERRFVDESFLPSLDQIRTANLKNHIDNGACFVFRPDTYKPVIDGIIPIPGRSAWTFTNNQFVLCRSNNTSGMHGGAKSLDEILAAASRFLKISNLGPLALEMSGGLDSAIIFVILKQLGVMPILIGYMRDRYEFRTERIIQENFMSQGSIVVRLTDNQGRPFEQLCSSPRHVLPDLASLSHAAHALVAQSAAEHGAKTVLNGIGADALLCNDMQGQNATNFPQDFAAWALADSWPNASIYQPRGMKYISPFALSPFPHLAWKSRRGLPGDPMKLNARSIFANLLPKELVTFAYKASHDGWIHDGIKQAASEIYTVASIAYKFYQNEELHPDKLHKQAEKSAFLSDDELKHFLSCVAFSVWIFGHINSTKICPTKAP